MTSVDIHDDDKTFENENSTVTIPLKEYDRLREKQKYITDKDMILLITLGYPGSGRRMNTLQTHYVNDLIKNFSWK